MDQVVAPPIRLAAREPGRVDLVDHVELADPFGHEHEPRTDDGKTIAPDHNL